jgi:hypothetical protein
LEYDQNSFGIVNQDFSISQNFQNIKKKEQEA